MKGGDGLIDLLARDSKYDKRCTYNDSHKHQHPPAMADHLVVVLQSFQNQLNIHRRMLSLKLERGFDQEDEREYPGDTRHEFLYIDSGPYSSAFGIYLFLLRRL